MLLLIIIPENDSSHIAAQITVMIFHEIATVMISDEITDSLISLLKVNYKNKICFSVQSLYRFTEN